MVDTPRPQGSVQRFEGPKPLVSPQDISVENPHRSSGPVERPRDITDVDPAPYPAVEQNLTQANLNELTPPLQPEVPEFKERSQG